MQKLNVAIQIELPRPEIRDKLQQQGFKPSHTTPEEFQRFLVEDMEEWVKLVKVSGARVE